MIGEQKTKDEGYVSIATKVPTHVAELLTMLARMRGMEVYELLQLLVNGFISYAKAETSVPDEFRHLYESLKFDVAWNRAFNFASPTAKSEIAQMVLVLQQPGKHGFGLTMIDKPWMGEPTMTLCIDDILERVIKLGMPGLDKRLEWIEQQFHCTSRRETLILLCEYMADYLKKEQDLAECPQLGNNHDWGRSMDEVRKYKRKPHRTPDSVANQQQTIQWTDDDREVADYEAKDWEGEYRQHGDDMPEGMVRPFDQEW